MVQETSVCVPLRVHGLRIFTIFQSQFKITTTFLDSPTMPPQQETQLKLITERALYYSSTYTFHFLAFRKWKRETESIYERELGNYLADIAVGRGGGGERDTLVLAGQFVGGVNLVVARAAERRLVGAADHGGFRCLASVALYLYLHLLVHSQNSKLFLSLNLHFQFQAGFKPLRIECTVLFYYYEKTWVELGF